MIVAFIPGDPGLLDLAGIVFLLVVVPLFVLAVVAIVTGYIQHDAEQLLEELAEEENATESAPDEDER